MIIEKQAPEARGATRTLLVGDGVRHDAARVFRSLFGSRPALIVADENTFRAAGRDVQASFERAGLPLDPPCLFGGDVWAEYEYFGTLLAHAGAVQGIPVAVGSGTINDLAKLAASRLGRPYMVVATAASMDGYTAFGASITHEGSKQTFDCQAPQAALADLETIAGAPEGMNSSGYADLLAKNAAGADWIVADALGVEPLHPEAWATVQGPLRSSVSAPGAVARGDRAALRDLIRGLMASGFAMQQTSSSRPASGAEHQFSHLWDMQGHTHKGRAPSHGFKVGVGTLASLALYENLLRRDFSVLDPDSAMEGWPEWELVESTIAGLFGPGALAEKALLETRAKYLDRASLRTQLTRLRAVWPDLRERLAQHLIPFEEARRMLTDAGCPVEPEQIGISRRRLLASYRQAYHIRRRFTVLDLARLTGASEEALAAIFGPQGRWPIGGPQ